MSEITATKEQQNKYEALKEYLRSLGSVAVAFSSGVDSTFLLKTAHDVLGDKMYRDYCHVLFFPEERTGGGESLL